MKEVCCKACFRQLPPGWCDLCPSCTLQTRERADQYVSPKRPSYATPLSQLGRDNGE